MVFKNHIAYRFLTDPSLRFEMCGETHPGDWKNLKIAAMNDIEAVKQKLKENMTPALEGFLYLTHPADNKTFYVTDTVLRNLDALKVSKNGSHYNWTVFKHLKGQKVTLILPNNRMLRIFVHLDLKLNKVVELFWLRFKKQEGSNIEGRMFWVMNYFYPDTGELSEHFDHSDTAEIEELLYKLMCFFYLAENTEEIIPPGRSYGTRKTGKVLNEFKFPVTMVNSKWNVKSIRTEGFQVSGHFRLQPVKDGHKMIFIDPFMKNGYTRRAQKDANLE